MPVYTYRAMTKDGHEVRNRIEDSSRSAIIKKIKRNGLMPISVVELKTKTQKNRKNVRDVEEMLENLNNGNVIKKQFKRKVSTKDKVSSFLVKTNKITPRDVIIFTQKFYLLKKANFNNIHALTTVIESTEHPRLKEILEDMLAGLEAGENMYSTMEYYPDVFPYIYVNMIKVGELSGSLTTSLQQGITYLEEMNSLTKRIRKILLPNILQFAGIFLMLILGTIFVIPIVQDVFDSVGTDEKLPAITIWFSNFLDTVTEVWYIPVLVILGVIGIIIFYINTPKGKYNWHYFKYTMPIFGQLIYALDFSRFMRAVLLNVENGMRIQDALEVSKSVVHNYVLLSVIETAINNILIGQSWIEPFEKTGLSTPMITEMLKIGMQTDLAEMMRKLVEYMQIDIDVIMGKIMKALPEVTYLFVGIILIFFVLVVLVPLMQIYMGSFLFSAYA